MILRPGDEGTLREALKRVPAAKLARSLGVKARDVRKWAVGGVPARKRDAREFRELIRQRDEVVRIQDIRRRARELVEREGFPKIAKVLKVGAATIRRWSLSRDPDRLEELIIGFKKGKGARKRLIERQKRGRDEERNFRALVKAAGETADIPIVRTGEGARSGKATQGYRWTKAFRENLSRDLLEDIEAWARGLPKKYPLFQLVARVSELALFPSKSLERKKKGGGNYPTVMVQLPHKKAGDFAIDALVTTGAFSIRSDVIDQFSDRLVDMMQGGAVKVFVHSVEMKNYRRRTKEQQASFEAIRRIRKQRKGKR